MIPFFNENHSLRPSYLTPQPAPQGREVHNRGCSVAQPPAYSLPTLSPAGAKLSFYQTPGRQRSVAKQAHFALAPATTRFSTALRALKTVFAAVALAATAVSFTGCATPTQRAYLTPEDVKAGAIEATKKFLNEVDFIPVDEYGKPIQRKYANGNGVVDANGQPVYTQYRIFIRKIEDAVPGHSLTPEQLTYTVTEALRDTRKAQPTDGKNADLELTGGVYQQKDWFFIRLRAKCLRPCREKQIGDYLVEKTYEVKPQQK